MNLLTAVENFLKFINNNWTTIIIIIGLLIALYEKIMKYLKLSKQEKVETALKIVKEEMLKRMSDAELEWKGYKDSGQLKKSQVIAEIYQEHPELKKYVNQDELIKMIEQIIDDNMAEMNKVINNIDPEETAKKLAENDNTNKPKTTETEDKK
jgi:vancomycin resistance protein YoaR